jgi:hypothetical protein
LFCLSWFSDKGLKAMSKTARGCRACALQQRPAILPWRFIPFGCERAIMRPFLFRRLLPPRE